jgi:hypothetical protein
LVKAEEAVMTVRLEIKPEIEVSLNAQAAAKGIPLDAYLQNVIEDIARAQAAPAANVEEFRSTLDTLAEMGKSLPHVPSAAFSRESIYRDHN